MRIRRDNVLESELKRNKNKVQTGADPTKRQAQGNAGVPEVKAKAKASPKKTNKEKQKERRERAKANAAAAAIDDWRPLKRFNAEIFIVGNAL